MKKELPCEMVRRDIKELIIERKLTVDTLSRITKINQQWFISVEKTPTSASGE
jgi:hypothetical protein